MRSRVPPPSARSACAPRSRTRLSSVSCEPRWQCRPASSSPGWASTRWIASAAAPELSEKPNFWSSTPVATLGCACAATAGVTRMRTRWRGGDSAVSRTISESAVDHDAPRAVVEGGPQVLGRLGVSVQDDPPGREAGRARHRELARRADVQAEALLGDPPRHGAAQEGLARVGDLPAGQRRQVGPAPVADVGLVDDVGRRAVGGRQRAQPDAADRDLAIRIEVRGPRPVVRRPAGYLLRRRRAVTSVPAGT